MWEDLYARHYEGNWRIRTQKPCPMPHAEYKSALAALYRSILIYLVTNYCYYSKSSAFRRGLDAAKWDDWATLLDEIREDERVFRAVSNVWRDIRYDEECEAILERWEGMSEVERYLEDSRFGRSGMLPLCMPYSDIENIIRLIMCFSDAHRIVNKTPQDP